MTGIRNIVIDSAALFFLLPLLVESVVPFDVLTAIINRRSVSLRVVGIPFMVLVAY